MAIKWTKTPVDWSAKAGPLSVNIQRKGDGRWKWQVSKDDQVHPMASGIANSVGAAKTVVEQFVHRSGLA